MDGFRACFAELVDPRRGNPQRHELNEIMMIALVAMLCGAESCVDMALFGRSKEPLLHRFLRLPGGVPSHDTFSRIFRLLDPEAFEACFGRYLNALAEQVAGVVAVDGKTARRSFDRRNRRPPLHLISAWACEQRLVLGQRRVDDRANEIGQTGRVCRRWYEPGFFPRAFRDLRHEAVGVFSPVCPERDAGSALVLRTVSAAATQAMLAELSRAMAPDARPDGPPQIAPAGTSPTNSKATATVTTTAARPRRAYLGAHAQSHSHSGAHRLRC